MTGSAIRPIGSREKLGIALDVQAFNILNSSRHLDRFVNWVTSGRVNQAVLGRRIVQFAIDRVTVPLMVSHKTLGERSSHIVPGMNTILFKGNLEQVKQAVGALTRDAVIQQLGEGHASLKTAVINMAADAAASVTSSMASGLGEASGEKLLATVTARHGWRPIKEMMEHTLGTFTGRDTIIHLIERAMNAAFLKNPALDTSHSAEYRTLADLAVISMDGTRKLYDARHISPPDANRLAALKQETRDKFTDVMRAYAPKTFELAQAAMSGFLHTQAATERLKAAVSQARDVVINLPQQVGNFARCAIDRVLLTQNIGTAPTLVEQAYRSTLEQVQRLSAHASDSAAADALLQTRAQIKANAASSSSAPPLESDSSMTDPDARTDGAAAMVDALIHNASGNPERVSQLSKIVAALDPQQIAPLGERSEVAVVKLATGTLHSVHATSHRWLDHDTPAHQAASQALEAGLARVSSETTRMGKFVVGAAFAEQVDALDMTMPASPAGNATGYGDWALQSARALVQRGWGLMGYGAIDSPDAAPMPRLEQLSALCGHDEQVLRVVTSYLDQNAMARLMSDSTSLLGRLAPASPDAAVEEATDGLRIDMDTRGSIVGGGVDIAGLSHPTIRFKVDRQGENTMIGIEASWPIVSYTAPGETSVRMPRAIPHGHNASKLERSAMLSVRADRNAPNGVHVSHLAMGTLATVENRIGFDLATGSMLSGDSPLS